MAGIAQSKKKQICSLLFVAALLGLTAYFLLRKQELPELLPLFRQIDGRFLWIGVGVMVLFFGCEAASLRLLLRVFRYRLSLARCYAYSLIDFYFSSITPGCCGGQPSQIYYMQRDGIQIGASSLCLLLFNLCYHVSALCITGASLCIGGKALLDELGHIKLFLLYGMAAQLGLVLAFCAMVFSRRLAPAALERMTSLLARIHVLRDRDAALARVRTQVEEYQKGAQFIRCHPCVVLVLLCFTTVHLLALYSLPYWIYRGFGLTGSGFLHILAVQASLTIAMESLPLPGGIGVTENGFLLLYGRIFGGLVLPAMLLCRGFNYYMSLLAGGAVTAIRQLHAPSRVHRQPD